MAPIWEGRVFYGLHDKLREDILRWGKHQPFGWLFSH